MSVFDKFVKSDSLLYTANFPIISIRYSNSCLVIKLTLKYKISSFVFDEFAGVKLSLLLVLYDGSELITEWLKILILKGKRNFSIRLFKNKKIYSDIFT